AEGIAVYDTLTGQETLVTNGGGDDFAPVGFSKDMSLLYFDSTRPYGTSPGNRVASLWVVDLATGDVTRLTNTDEESVRKGVMVPTISPAAIWTSDRATAVTSYGSDMGVWRIDLVGHRVVARRISDGDSPTWLVPDETIDVRRVVNGRETHVQETVR
ncbi:MAG: hypothetical protein RLZZ324_1107, partial [Candidatus Parcubacteria bacterium]